MLEFKKTYHERQKFIISQYLPFKVIKSINFYREQKFLWDFFHAIEQEGGSCRIHNFFHLYPDLIFILNKI